MMINSYLKDQDSTDDDDEALWINPGQDNLPTNLPAVSPWRAPNAYNRNVRTKALMRAVRGTAIWGLIDIKVILWFVVHVSVPLLLLYIDEDARQIFSKALGRDQSAAGEDARGLSTEIPQDPGSGGVRWALLRPERLLLLVLLGLMATALGLFGSLYASNPGWIHAGFPAVDLALDSGRGPCPQCGEVPSLRSHHDKRTGQCVHKYDHHCWFLSATIGDLNHARFVWLLFVEVALLTWLQCWLMPLALSCGMMQSRWLSAGRRAQTGSPPSPLTSCPRVPSWDRMVVLWLLLAFGAVVLVLVMHLALIHGYLVATNQATLELLKGPRLPYLSRAYASLPPSRPGGGCKTGMTSDSHGEVSLTQIVRQHWQGVTPPRPFDEGLLRNLRIFFLEPKPHPYRYRTGITELALQPVATSTRRPQSAAWWPTSMTA
ncbi:hypothetical protein VaNZ11_013591 [Volvox africanus]|uniref:S-acyltransferase n=1 Tax=Volvox africanus TaxID=51714 RepID=A0ABQ5SI08_9CHLO|nr:hypothetical protein VaNZ11_013591 [Volvox africanus]